ncbi:MAG: methyltransferase domain-containing protein [Candidatus Paceibacterota bacterium]
MIEIEKIKQKFGENFETDEQTFVMGIHKDFANKIAKRFSRCKKVLDSCAGAGFMSIVLAQYVEEVIAVDIDSSHLEMAKHNALIAGVQDKIRFIHGDILNKKILDQIENIDGAFLDPDWSIEQNKRIHVTSLKSMIPQADLLFKEISLKTNNIALRLPKELNLSELADLPKHEVEEEIMENKLKFYSIYFGNLI